MSQDLQQLIDQAIAAEQAPVSGSKGSKKPPPPRTPVEAKDSLRSRAYVQTVDLISEGEIVGLVDGFKSIYLDDTPVQNEDGTYNFKDVVYQSTDGTPFQDYLPRATIVEREVSLNQDLKKNFPITKTVDNPDVDALRIKIRVPALMQQNPSNGDTNGTSVSVNIYLSGPDTPGYQLAKTETISGKTTNPYERQVTILLNGPGPWQVKFERVEADSTSSTLQNDTSIAGYTEVVYAKLRYPYCALVGMQFDAEQFANVPSRSFLIKGLKVKVPTNYDPVARTYAGIWNGSFKWAWTNNPAWCFYDMVLNKRYGLGQHITEAEIDKWQLYEIAKYCDELVPDGDGGLEPRFTMNAYIQTRQEAIQLLRSMASTFRAMLFWAGSQIFLSQDRPAYPIWTYTNANVIDGEFMYNSTNVNQRHTVAFVSYNNPLDGYKLDKEYVEDEDAIKRYGINPLDVTAWGCTSRGQAIRFGRWALYAETTETDVVTFKTSLEGLKCYPGSIVMVHDSSRMGLRMGGRVVNFTSDYADLDAELVMESTDVTTFYWMSADGRLCTRQLGRIDGELTRITFAVPVAPTDFPAEQGVWTASASSINGRPYRVMSVREENQVFTITAIEHNPNKYLQVERGIEKPELPYIRKPNPSNPTDLTLTENLYVSGEALKVSITLSVDADIEARLYHFSYRRVGDTWNYATSVEPNITIRDVPVGDYEVECYITNVLKLRSGVERWTGKVYGKMKPPANVTGFAAKLTPSGITMTWDSVPDLDLDGYELRVGPSWEAGTRLAFVKATTASWTPPQAGLSFTFHIRARDTSGNLSLMPTTLQAKFSRPQNVEAMSVVQSGSRLRFKWAESDNAAFYIVRCGQSFELGEPLFKTPALTYEIEWGRVGVKYFWVKAVDYIGNTSETAMFATMETAQPSGRNQLLLYNYQQLGWPGATYNLDTVGNDLELVDGANYGEYFYSVVLNKTFRSLVTVDYDMQALVDSGLTWNDLDFSWDSSDADMPWADGGDFDSVSTETWISYRTAIPDNVIVSFRLNGVLTSLDLATAPVSSRGVSYAPCRYADGLFVKDTTFVHWQKPIPAHFSQVFTMRFKSLAHCQGLIVLKDQATGRQMRVIYRREERVLVLETSYDKVEVSVPLDAKLEELLLIGVSQDTVAGTRNLFAQRLGYAHVYASSPITVMQGFTDIAMTGHYL